MKATVISFISAKGGSGKTITAASLAAFLSFLRKKVLIIDCDAATNGLTLFFLDDIIDRKSKDSVNGQVRGKSGRQLLGIFESANVEEQTNRSEKIDEGHEPSKPSLPIHIQTRQNFFVIPSSFVQMRTQDVDVSRFELKLRETINMYRKDFDYIFLDAQAGADEFAEAAVRNSDENVIVSEYDPVSVQGVERLKSLFSDSLDPNRTWTLYNKLLPEVAEKFSEFLIITRILSPIPWDAEVVRAFARQELPLNMEDGSTHTFAIMRTARMLFRKNVDTDIENWLGEKESKIKGPSKKLLEDYERKVNELRDMQKDINVKMRTTLVVEDAFIPLLAATFLFAAVMSVYYIVERSNKFLGESVVRSIFVIVREEPIAVITGAIFLVLSLAVLVFKRMLFRRSVIREESQKAELSVIQEKIEELSEERRRLRSFLETDIEKIVR